MIKVSSIGVSHRCNVEDVFPAPVDLSGKPLDTNGNAWFKKFCHERKSKVLLKKQPICNLDRYALLCSLQASVLLAQSTHDELAQNIETRGRKGTADLKRGSERGCCSGERCFWCQTGAQNATSWKQRSEVLHDRLVGTFIRS